MLGMDPDGRIPRVGLPEDLANPDRWRYIPEGRLMPGNVFQRILVSSFIAPIFFFEEDVGFGGGVALTDIDFRTQRRREFAGIFVSYTTEGQQKYAMVWQRWLHHRDLPEGGVIQEERSLVRASLGYERPLTLRFFGLGPDTTENDETSYSREHVWAGLHLQQSLPGPGDGLVFHAGMRYERHNLGGGRVSSRPTTEATFPALFLAGDDHDGLWLSTGLRYDTRDSQHNPYSGWMAGLSADAVAGQSHGDVGAILGLHGNWVTPVPGLFHSGGDPEEEHPPTDTLAFDLRLGWAEGDLPFWALPTLGGRDTLRGYIGHRWTGRAAWHASAEYRFWWLPRGFSITDTIRIERLGAALFYDVGSVADGLDDLDDAKVHHSYGVSLRMSLERKALFRFDVGFSDEDINYVVAYGLSF
jgi:hypothetical protein